MDIKHRLLFVLIFFCLPFCSPGIAHAGKVIITSSSSASRMIGKEVEYFEDKTGTLSLDSVIHAAFIPSPLTVPSFGLTRSTYWFRFEIVNRSDFANILLEIKNPTITTITLYEMDGDRVVSTQYSGEVVPIQKREVHYQNPIFPLLIAKDSSQVFYLKVSSKKILSIPLFLGNGRNILSSIGTEEYIFGVYLGIILIMLFYNLFLFVSVKDIDYLNYVLYTLGVGLAQAGLKGYTFRFLWPGSSLLAEQSTNIFIALSGIFSIIFTKHFLHLKNYYPRILRLLNIVIFIYCGAIALNIGGYLIQAQNIIQANTFVGSITLMVCGIMVQRKGFRPALFFNIAWSFFIFSVLIYLTKDLGLLPFTNLTSNSILLGSAIEATLLSFALADKINTYKREKETSQALALKLAQEREVEAQQQSAILEVKVRERTEEVQQANERLTNAMENLKSAQSQLVHAEKMSSLGQLTAGIAHEINNPINFVKSNIKPLELDINDLLKVIKKYEELDDSDNIAAQLKEIEKFKQEIDIEYIHTEIQSLIKGIEEGAVRTADIVKGLRTFSRLDEDELKYADVQAGLDATLNLIRNNIPENINVVKNYGIIPEIECYPGKLNQVFMNILTNAVQAIRSKPGKVAETITITTSRWEDKVQIRISDTGTGMPPEVREKIFEPFFTTKDVGEGTGLGLSIAFNIIEKHHGLIEVNTSYGKGSEFIITLPINQLIIEFKGGLPDNGHEHTDKITT